MPLFHDPKTSIGVETAIGLMDDQPRKPVQRNVSLVTAFPLLALPWFVYNVLAIISWIGGSDSNAAYNAMTQVIVTLPMPSPGTQWVIQVGDVILLGALICLFFELLKSTKSDKVAIINHSLSMMLFIVALVEFLLLRPFSTSTFFLLTAMILMDVLAGFIVTAISARKDIDFGA